MRTTNEIMNSTYRPITRLRLKRFRSLLWADVNLNNPTFIVGKNGSGKSNFLKALEFFSDCMSYSLETVFQIHGGLETMRFRTSGRSRPGNFGMRVDFNIGDDPGWYAFEIKAMPGHRFQVVREQCVCGDASFDRKGSRIRISSKGAAPAITDEALILPLLAGTPDFKPVKELLSSIEVFSIEPAKIHELQDPDAGTILKPDGSNLSSVLLGMDHENLVRLCQLLGSVVPGVTNVKPAKHGKKLSLRFTQQWSSKTNKIEESSHEAYAMSDGTLRILGILTAFFQKNRPKVIAMEEPESTIHPEALSTLLEQIRGFSKDTQIIVTTHSPELLESKWIEGENLLVSVWDKGISQILPLNQNSRDVLREHLLGAGELMRTEGLQPEELFNDLSPEQKELFSELPC